MRLAGDDDEFLLRMAEVHDSEAHSFEIVEDHVVVVTANLALRRPVARVTLASREARRGCGFLAAAYTVAVWREQVAAGLPILGPCLDCGQPTGCFCDGCGQPRCTVCDDDGSVCTVCQRPTVARHPLAAARPRSSAVDAADGAAPGTQD